MNYEERDTYGMYKANIFGGTGIVVRLGPGPELMGAYPSWEKGIHDHCAKKPYSGDLIV